MSQISVKLPTESHSCTGEHNDTDLWFGKVCTMPWSLQSTCAAWLRLTLTIRVTTSIIATPLWSVTLTWSRTSTLQEFIKSGWSCDVIALELCLILMLNYTLVLRRQKAPTL